MATKRMLVDATHPEETRIVVTNGNRLEEFDFESASRRQLRGNIYLAKVTRVEPSLQAAFIEYGGNRHGFLAFSEIHPDYYQIPVADREALLRQEAEEDEAEEDDAEEPASAEAAGSASESDNADEESEDSTTSEDGDADETPGSPTTMAATDGLEDSVSEPVGGDSETKPEAPPTVAADGEHDDEAGEAGNDGSHIEEAPQSNEPVESIGGGDALEEIQERRRPMNRMRQYKIQEVIKRRQVMLVQVVKEERGNKGAALTTYLSLAGRYSVLMPNTARGGGISRKITNAADRKRLKEIVGDLEVPQGQGIILRTAGASRTKAEVKRDFEYLQRLWENVRTLTLKSTAPCLVYEEGSLIKRTIRDLYSKDIDELWVSGDSAYREAKDFMQMIMPSHAKNVQLYADDQPVFSKYGVEGQLDQMFSPQVTLPSGGYLVINPTEALVSIDVNSGRSTKEHNIEDTALQTNLEAADEVARQLRLRDLAGLIVIDFIDMMENRSNRAVERRLKEALKDDRARIQVGRLSHFGLLEMSRQRIRQGVIESSTHKCPTCNGTGIVRSVESLALMVMRQVEDHVLRRPGQSINVRVPTDVALYILNGKRGTLSALEQKYDLSITIVADDHVGPSHFAIERGEARVADRSEIAGTHVRVDTAILPDAVDVDEDEEEDEEETASANGEDRGGHREENGERGGRRRRRRRGRGDREERQDHQQQQPAPELHANANADDSDDGDDDEGAEGEGEEIAAENGQPRANGNGEEPRRRRRRGRRGGRRNRREGEPAREGEADVPAMAAEASAEPVAGPYEAPPVTISEAASDRIAAAVLSQDAIAQEVGVTPDISVAEDAPKPRRSRRKAAPAEGAEGAVAPTEEAAPAAKTPRPRRSRKAAPPPAEADALAAAEVVAVAAPDVAAASVVPAAVPEPKIADEPEPVAESSRPARQRKEIPEGEILVSSTAAGEAPAEEAKPKRAGWWQRRLGFGS